MESPGQHFRHGFQICIVGAGVVGLAGALLLHQQGFRVTVLERDQALRVIGAGIQLHPNAIRVLKDVGVWDKISKRSVFPEALVYKAYKTGQILHSQDLSGNEKRYGVPLATVHRGHMSEILYAEVLARGIVVRHGVHVNLASIDLDHGTLKIPNSPEVLRANLFIGADGNQSVIRQALVGRQEMVPHGKIVHRVLVDKSNMVLNPRLQHLLEPPNCVVWLGPECQAVTYGLDGIFNIALTWPWSTDPRDAFTQGQPFELASLEAKLTTWDPVLRELVSLGRNCTRWMLFDQKVNDDNTPWVSEKGNFCLAGDAAHGLLPYLAQGAAVGLESISVLAHLLGRAETPERIQECLQIYQKVRKERTGHIARATLKNGYHAQMADGPLQEARDRELLNDVPTAGCPNLLADPFFQYWLWSFDAKQAAEQAYVALRAAE